MTDDYRFAALRDAVQAMLRLRIPRAVYKQIGPRVGRWTLGNGVANLSLLYELDDTPAQVLVGADTGPISIDAFGLDANPMAIATLIESLLNGTTG